MCFQGVDALWIRNQVTRKNENMFPQIVLESETGVQSDMEHPAAYDRMDAPAVTG